MILEKGTLRNGTPIINYRVRYKTPDGVSHRRSFRTQAEAAEFECAIRDAKKLPTILAQRQAIAAVSRPIPLDDCIRKFLAASTSGTRGRAVLADNTLRNYGIKLALALQHIEERDVRKIQRKHVVTLKDKLVELNYARKTVNHVLVTLRVLCNWLIDEGLIDLNPTTRVTLKKDRNYPQEHVEQTDIYSDRDVDVILSTFDEDLFTGLRDKACLQLGFFCGLRISEVLGLEWRHIDFERKHITVAQSAHDRKGTIQRTKSAASRRVASSR